MRKLKYARFRRRIPTHGPENVFALVLVGNADVNYARAPEVALCLCDARLRACVPRARLPPRMQAKALPRKRPRA